MEGVMTGKIWYFNAKSNSSETFEFSRNQMEINKVLTHQNRDQLASLQDCALGPVWNRSFGIARAGAAFICRC